MTIDEIKQKYLVDGEYSKVVNQINHGKKNWASSFGGGVEGKNKAKELAATEKKISYAEISRKSLGSAVTVHYNVGKNKFFIGIKSANPAMNIVEAKGIAQNLLKACKIVEQAPT